MIAFAVIMFGKGTPEPKCVGVFQQKFRANEYAGFCSKNDSTCLYRVEQTDISGGAFERIRDRAVRKGNYI